MSADVRGEALPLRTGRRRPAGRHRSPDRLSVPSDAPALVLAVPGAACSASEDISAGIAASASRSCPGVLVRAGYLEGDRDNLTAVLADLPTGGAGHWRAAVVVPLLTGPHPSADMALATAVAKAGVPAVRTGHLGPHPLLGEALHARLAQAGLARVGRMRQINIVGAADGVLMVVAGGPASAGEAGMIAVLLAARLAVPVMPAALGDPTSMAEAVARLRQARATRLALAPCVIGPEADIGELAATAAETGAACAQPLGAHPALGRLVAIRYGAALQDPRIALS